MASTQAPRVIVAPEVAARLMTRRQAGEHVAGIGRDLHMTPFEVSGVLRDAERIKWVGPESAVRGWRGWISRAVAAPGTASAARDGR